MDETSWWEDLQGWAKEQLGGVQASGEIGGVDVAVGRLPGPSWPAVALTLVVILIVALVWR